MEIGKLEKLKMENGKLEKLKMENWKIGKLENWKIMFLLVRTHNRRQRFQMSNSHVSRYTRLFNTY